MLLMPAAVFRVGANPLDYYQPRVVRDHGFHPEVIPTHVEDRDVVS